MRAAVYLQFAASTFSIAGTHVAHVMLIVGFCAYRAVHPVRAWLPVWIVAPFLGFAGAVVVSALVNPEPWENLARIGGSTRVVLVPFLLLFALQWVETRRLMQVLLVFVVGVSIYGILQHYTGITRFTYNGVDFAHPFLDRWRARGNFNNPMTYSGVVLILAPLMLALGIGDRSRWRWGWLAGGLLASAGVVYSLTRSSVVGLVLGLLVLGLRLHTRIAIAMIALVVLAGTLGTAALLSGTSIPREDVERLPHAMRRFAEIDLSDWSILTRVYLWEASLLAFRDKPWLGHGLNQDTDTRSYYHRLVSEKRGGFGFGSSLGAPSHNIYLRVLFELGAIGLIAYLWLWGSVLTWTAHWLKRAGPGFTWERSVLWGVLAGLLGSMAAGFFEDNFFDGEVQTLITMLMGLSLYMGQRVRAQGVNGLAYEGPGRAEGQSPSQPAPETDAGTH